LQEYNPGRLTNPTLFYSPPTNVFGVYPKCQYKRTSARTLQVASARPITEQNNNCLQIVNTLRNSSRWLSLLTRHAPCQNVSDKQKSSNHALAQCCPTLEEIYNNAAQKYLYLKYFIKTLCKILHYIQLNLNFRS